MLRTFNSSSSVLRYRVAIALLSLFMLYQWRCYTQELAKLQRHHESEISICRENSESIMAKIEVVYNHKVKLERVLEAIRINKTELTGTKSSLQKCLLESSLTKSRLRQCEEDLKESNKTLHENLENAPVNENKDATKLHQRIQDLEAKLSSNEEKLQRQNIDFTELKDKLANCEKSMVQYVGAVPVAHYSRNDTSSFQRKHKANEALSFNRDAMEVHQPANLMSGAELARKLEARKAVIKEQEEVHPDDREEKDEYVDDVRNKEEKDYKEGP